MLYKNINVVVLLLSVCYLPTYCLDYMPHTAIDNVPAVLGQPLQIRCTKVTTNGYTYAGCLSSCEHFWTRNGEALSNDFKYSINSTISYGYCETFEGTSDLIRKMNINPPKYGYGIDCLSSFLTISNVTEADLGEYKCVLNNKKRKKKNYDSTISQTIRVYDAASQEQMPKKIEYSQGSYLKKRQHLIGSKLLMQCVVTGGTVYWFIRFPTDDCGRFEDSRSECIDKNIQPINDVEQLYGWRSFNLTTDDHHPYNSNQIAESFIYFQKISLLDWAGIYCSADPLGKVRTKVAEIVMDDPYNGHDPYSWDRIYMRKFFNIFVTAVIVIFFMVGCCMSCSRAGVGRFRGRQTFTSYYQSIIQTADPETVH